ncbi:hypothetical protein E2C01_062634 [Portunus trituberculatus]|uniref:Uncharacterized protein n=1 Tax=Portunus trituberculatus TaxID=210409 RepID=A0A5B7HBN0_PORTR|nr:hypothetical protein [Portunus trituberculatus]
MYFTSPGLHFRTALAFSSIPTPSSSSLPVSHSSAGSFIWSSAWDVEGQGKHFLPHERYNNPLLVLHYPSCTFLSPPKLPRAPHLHPTTSPAPSLTPQCLIASLTTLLGHNIYFPS